MALDKTWGEGGGGWKQERSERLQGKWVNRLALSPVHLLCLSISPVESTEHFE